MNYNKKNNTMLIILLIVFLVILISFITYIALNKKKDLPDNEDNNIKEDVKKKLGLEPDEEFFVTKGSEKLFTIGTIENIQFEDKSYSKIKITFNNNTEYNALMSQYMFRLVDENKNLINYCYTAAYGSFKNMDDIFPDIAPSSTISEGYLYCVCSSENAKYLKMSYLLHPIFDENDEDVGSEDYYFELVQ